MDDPAKRTESPWTRDVLAGTAAAVLALVLHIDGFSLGFWFDDHNHLELCKANGFHDLAAGNRFDWTGRLARVWWARQETGWAYYRPLTVALRTALLQTYGLNPTPFHVLHLALHIATVVLLYGLVRGCGGRLWTALTAAAFFTLHPANAVTTAWVANDGPVLVGFWTLLGLICLLASARAGHRRVGWLLGVVLCYGGALTSRENGIMLGPMLVLFDLLVGRSLPASSPSPEWRRRGLLYLSLTALAVAYLIIRSSSLGPGSLPRRPYVYWPTEAGFGVWLPYKALSDALCLLLGLPIFPIVQVTWLQHRPWTTACAAILLLAVLALIVVPLRRSRACWGLLTTVALALAPTLLVFSAGYNVYVATIGWAVLLALWARQCVPARPRWAGGALAVLAGWYLFGWWSGTLTAHAGATLEHGALAEVQASHPASYPPGGRMFFIDMPFFAAELGPAVRLTANRDDLETYLLTLTPEPFCPRRSVAVELENDRTLVLRRDDDGWFPGSFGEEVQLGWFGAARRDLPVGAVSLSAPAGPMPFRVEVVAANSRGVAALRFIFDRALDDPSSRFFLGSPEQGVAPLVFARSSDGALHRVEAAARERSAEELRDFARAWRLQAAFERFSGFLASWR